MFELTREQTQIIEAGKAGSNIAITAGAGTGKTATLVELTKNYRKETLYIAFNKSIADEAKSKFPSWVECRTIHSLAYREVVCPKFRKKVAGYYSFKEVLSLFPDLVAMNSKEAGLVVSKLLEYFKRWCASAELTLTEFAEANSGEEEIQMLLPRLEFLWDVASDKDHPFVVSQDVYLKMFQLTQPDFGKELVLLDEGQDSNPVTLSMFYNQKSQKVIVGDPYQAIYEFRYATDAFESIPENFVRLQLSESFRFTQNIADSACKVIRAMGGSFKVTGRAKFQTPTTKAVLVRNNSTLVTYLLAAHKYQQKVYVIGDLKQLWTSLYSANNLQYNGDPAKRYDKYIASFKSWNDLVTMSKKDGGLAKLVTLCKTYPKIHDVIVKCKEVLVDDVKDANFTLATGHKSKGLEWDSVTLASDFLYRREDQEDWTDREILEEGQTGNLLYVAMTRAKFELNYPEEFNEFLTPMDWG